MLRFTFIMSTEPDGFKGTRNLTLYIVRSDSVNVVNVKYVKEQWIHMKNGLMC